METTTPKLNGYGQAVIHLAWCRDYQNRHLLFGMVELRPIELPSVSSCSVKSTRYGSNGGKYIHYRRFAYTVDTAIQWYEAALAGNTVLPVDTNHRTKGDGAELQTADFVQEPPWPELVTSNDLAFAPDWMQGSRSHFLFPRKVLPPEIVEIINAEKIRQQLEEWLNFDIISAYPEYQGTICLVAPNPLFRSIDKSHLEIPNPSFVESVAYKVVLRSGQSVDRLRLEVINERPRGRITPFVKEFAGDAIAVFDSPAELDKEGRSVTHPDHGLLS